MLNMQEDKILSRAPEHRWAWAEINTSALKRNILSFKSKLSERTKIMCVVKADAYGHGACELASICRVAGAHMLGVATVDEGIKLRKAGLDLPILILSQPPLSAIPALLEYEIIPSIYTMEFALELGEAAVALGLEAPYHLKIDTGMNRVGVAFDEVVEFMRLISFHKGLRLDGCFTHFATAEALNDWDFALQLKRFVEALESLHHEGIDLGTVHCCNTAATLLHPEAHFDMVRIGIGIYGLYPAPSCYHKIKLEPVMSIKARAAYVKSPMIGEGVSYGMTYRVPKHLQIASLPIGYADGLARGLSNQMDMLYQGQRVSQVGAICMDQCMVEIDPTPTRGAAIKPIEIGDELIIVGEDGSEEISLDELAYKLNTINYELACAFGMRLDRVYLAK